MPVRRRALFVKATSQSPGLPETLATAYNHRKFTGGAVSNEPYSYNLRQNMEMEYYRVIH